MFVNVKYSVFSENFLFGQVYVRLVMYNDGNKSQFECEKKGRIVMKTYLIAYKHSRDGKSWSVCSSSVKAESESDAIRQLERKYNYVKDIRVQSVK